MRRPGPNHREADTLEGLCQVQNQGYRSLILFFCFVTKSFHFHKYFPHRLLSSSVSTIRGVPIHAILLLPRRHFWRSPSNQRWHERNRALTCNILRNREEHRRTSLLRPLATISPLVSFVTSKRTFRWKPSHSTPVFALYNLDTLSTSTSSNLGSASSNLFNSSSSKAYPPPSARFRHTASALPILPSLLHSGPAAWHPLLPS